MLGVEQVVASPIAMGHGVIAASHGVLPNPPPAVVRLLAGRGVPVIGVETGMELATPTGVALLVALADRFGALPAMDVRGRRLRRRHGRPARPAQRRAGRARHGGDRPSARRRPGRAAVVLEVNVDDVTGEVLAHTIAALLAAGAHDAWATPIVMKKGRPAHTVTALVDPVDVARLGAVLLAETGSLGVRATTVERWPQQREEITVVVGGHPSGSRSAAAGPRPSTTTRSRPRRRSAARCATSCATPRPPSVCRLTPARSGRDQTTEGQVATAWSASSCRRLIGCSPDSMRRDSAVGVDEHDVREAGHAVLLGERALLVVGEHGPRPAHRRSATRPGG